MKMITRLRYWVAGLTSTQRELIAHGITIQLNDLNIVRCSSLTIKPSTWGHRVDFQKLIDTIFRIKLNVDQPATTGNWHRLWLTPAEVDLVKWGIILSKEECLLIMRALEAYMESLKPAYTTKKDYLHWLENPPQQYKDVQQLYERIFKYFKTR